jgi:hypothetical protein
VRRRHRLQFSTETRRPFGGKRAGGLGRPGTGETGVGVGMRDSNGVAGALLRLHCTYSFDLGSTWEDTAG